MEREMVPLWLGELERGVGMIQQPPQKMSQLWRGEMLIHLPVEKTEPGTGITQGFGEEIGHKDGLDGEGWTSDLLTTINSEMFDVLGGKPA